MNSINLEINKGKERIVYLCLFLVAFLFLLAFSRATSPLYTYYGLDSPIFISMAKMFLDGKTLYVDCFDHKGPVLFFMHAFAQLFGANCEGAFIFQTFNLFLSLVVLYKLSKLFVASPWQLVCVLLSFLFLLSLTIEEGNQTEEFSLFFVLLSVYFTLSHYYYKNSLTKAKIFAMGWCFGMVFWIRPNNTGIMCACIAFLFIVFLRERKPVVSLLTYFTLGFASLSAIICVYFYSKNALDEMLYASFLFNFKYIKYEFSYSSKSFLMSVFFNAGIVFSLLLATYLTYKKEKDANVILLLILLLLFGFLPANMIKLGQFQYKGLLVPIFSISLLLFFRAVSLSVLQTKVIKLSSAFMLVLLMLVFAMRYDKYKNFDEAYIESAKNMVSKIPTKEMSNVFGYQTEAKIFLATELKPSFKYYIIQEFHGTHDKQVIDSVNKMLEEKSPKWIFTQNSLMKHTKNPIFGKIINNRYKLFYEDDILSLYRLVD